MKRHALFVGVDDYADPTIQNLDFPSEDAGELASVFRRLLKFDRVEKLVNPAHAPDVVDAIKGMTRGLGPGDLFLFFFAGHGFRVKENHVLVCAKDEYADLEDEYAGLPVGQLKRRMRGPWNRMLVLDACQNDIRATRGADAGVTSRDLGLIHAVEDGGRDAGFQIVVTSCSEGQKALEVADLGHGLFTSAFLDSVTSFADARRRIDLESLRTDLGARMGGLIDRYRLAGRQEPMFSMPANASGLVLLDGASSPPLDDIPPLVVCPDCGLRHELKDTFRCRVCGRDYLCLDHYDKTTKSCTDCAEKARREAAKRKAAEELARREREWVERRVREYAARVEASRKTREEAERKAREWFGTQAGERKVVRVGSVDVPLRWCPPGSFTMGSANGDSSALDNEKPQIQVTVREGFWMGETEVTQALWEKVMGENPSANKKGGSYPVEQVSWNDCRVFLAKLNDMDSVREAGLEFRLPTEDEWEHACRAGSTGDYCRLADGTEIMKKSLGRVAWFIENSGGTTHLVGRKEPNAWGLYDMHGNVWEWTLTAVGEFRVNRGGCWDNSAGNCVASRRFRFSPSRRYDSIGFRLCASGRAD